MEFNQLIRYSNTLLPLISIFFFILLWKHIKKQDRSLLQYVVFSFILFGSCSIVEGYNENKLPLYNIYSLAELSFVSHYILKLIFKKPFTRAYFIITASYFVFWLSNIIFFEPMSVFNVNSALLANLIILLLCMYYLLILSAREEILYFQKFTAFWIVSGFLIYAAISLLVFISNAYINFGAATKETETGQFLVISSIAIIVKYVFMVAGLICYKHNSKSPLRIESVLFV
jgi:hypothetical protein